MCAEGWANAQVALDLGVSRETVRKWRARFLADRLAGLVDRAAFGRRPQLEGGHRVRRAEYGIPPPAARRPEWRRALGHFLWITLLTR